MTPQERNQLIDEVIEGLKDSHELGHPLSICAELHSLLWLQDLEQLTRFANFAFMAIPVLGDINTYWWPSDDLESRILFLKSVKTCHK